MGQPVMQWQILARDPDKLTAFYGKLFGWQRERRTTQWATGWWTRDSERGINGGVWPIGTEGHPLVQLFVEVDDVAACVAEVERLGGQVVIPPQVLPDGDELAIVLDTEGLSLGVMKRQQPSRSVVRARTSSRSATERSSKCDSNGAAPRRDDGSGVVFAREGADCLHVVEARDGHELFLRAITAAKQRRAAKARPRDGYQAGSRSAASPRTRPRARVSSNRATLC